MQIRKLADWDHNSGDETHVRISFEVESNGAIHRHLAIEATTFGTIPTTSLSPTDDEPDITIHKLDKRT